MNKITKRTPALVLALSLLLCVSACEHEDASESSNPLEFPESPEPTQEGGNPQPEDTFLDGKTIVENGKLQDYSIAFAGAERVQDTGHQAAIVFYYDFTNNSSVTTSAFLSLSSLAYQDGKELRNAETLHELPYWYNDSYEIRPGATIRCCEIFSYNPEGGTISFQIWQWAGERTQIAFASYEPSQIPGQNGSFDIPPAVSPYVGGTYNQVGAWGPLEVTIGNSEFVPDSNGNDYIRIYLDFTNGSQDTISFASQFDFIAFQDNIELQYGYPSEPLPQDGGAWLEVQPGKTVSLALTFALRTHSPVVLEITDFAKSLTIGGLYE